MADLLQTSHYLDMFNDKARNNAYRLALEAVIQAGRANTAFDGLHLLCPDIKHLAVLSSLQSHLLSGMSLTAPAI